MFSYIDKSIREKLKNDDRLISLNREGKPVGEGEAAWLSLLGPIPMPRTIAGKEVTLHWYPFVRRVELTKVLDAAAGVKGAGSEAFRELIQTNMSVNSVLALPGSEKVEKPLVRVHSCCLTGDVFGSLRCECGPQLQKAFEMMVEEGHGMVVYMTGHEGRGIGLWAKAVTYLLQDDGQDTYQANVSLGLPEDSRDFTDAAVVLRYLVNGRPIRLLSNNPFKKKQLVEAGQEVAEVVPFLTGVSQYNERYLKSKRSKGHFLPEDV